MRRIIFAILGIVLSISMFGQKKQHELITDRPDQTESSVTVPKGGLQIETGILLETDKIINKTKRILTYNTTLIRYGLLENFEIRIGFDYINYQYKYKDIYRQDIDISGFTPPLLGFKIAISNQKKILPELALLTHLILPRIGHDDFEQSYMTPEMILSAGWELNSIFSTAINIGSVWNYNFSRFYKAIEMPHGVFSWVLGISINDKLASFIETYGTFEKGEYTEYLLDGGFTYLILPNLQFDVSSGFGVTEDATGYFTSCGLSALFVK